ncbi:MAG TPA: nucleotidyltransferase family protein [Casimicrobiaceae bacterium]|nr:nucleotidyltransferase family protein [Casimicrobiaceae bacterium]
MLDDVQPVVGVLLAAGSGARFGGHKLRAMLHGGRDAGVTLGVAAGRNLLHALSASIAVVRADDSRLAADLSAIGLRVVPCTRADEGMGASLACGVQATSDAAGWVVALADMPWIAPATIRAVAQAITSGADVAAPFHRGKRGHPVGFSRGRYTDLATLTGDAGAKSIVERAGAALVAIDVEDAGVLRDVDVREDIVPDSTRR